MKSKLVIASLLFPRRINQAIKNELRAAGMKYEGSRDVNEAYTPVSYTHLYRIPLVVFPRRQGERPFRKSKNKESRLNISQSAFLPLTGGRSFKKAITP